MPWELKTMKEYMRSKEKIAYYVLLLDLLSFRRDEVHTPPVVVGQVDSVLPVHRDASGELQLFVILVVKT